MASSRKKVIVRLLSGDLLHGYLPAAAFVRHEPPAAALLDLLDLAGRILPLALQDIKLIHYVRDFNLDDTRNPERLTRTAFLARPRNEGLWLCITFAAGDQLEGLAPLDVTLLDGLVEDSGLFLTPPDDRTNTHRVFVPRPAIAALQLLAVVTTPSRKVAKPSADPQPNLFPETP
ncbi:DUF6982 domain-containing protein [Granulicella sibirica]|uniref:Uncharacterized protein n=1 Tax=Granulicella sibirica TaxID=2479048 RepID=A0A4Q0T4S1_9BACT|nr:hypothetical protein [Granulicella sibirica]RXH56576.1 hypothetical protein GRAN_3433 [Granulicella sibirica]